MNSTASEQLDEQYAAHSIWNTLDTAAESVSEQPDDTDKVKLWKAQIRSVLEFLQGQRESRDDLVTTDYLNDLAQRVNNVQAAFQNWKTNPGAYLSNLNSAHEAVASAARNYPRTKDNYSRGVRQELRNRQTEFDAAVTRAQQALQELEGAVAEQQTQVDAIQASADAVKVAVDGQEERLDTALANFETRFTASQTDRENLFRTGSADLQRTAQEALEQARASAEQEAKERQEAADAIVGRIRALEGEARKLVETIGLKGTTSGYADYANKQRSTADWLRAGAIVLYGLAAILFGFLFLNSTDHADMSWQSTTLKLGISLALIAGGGYLSHESTLHRREERRARTEELRLKAFEPFVANLDADNRESLRALTAYKAFIDSTGTQPPEELRSGLDDLLKLFKRKDRQSVDDAPTQTPPPAEQ